MGAAVGIDLGTTNTVVAAVREGKAITLADEEGQKLLPSVVSFHPSGNVLVGRKARERRLVDSRNTIASIKRLIGRAWDSAEVQNARIQLPFAIAEGTKRGIMVVARGEMYTLPEISAYVLRRAKEIAERVLGEVVDRAVITVPANFNDLQRAATKVAGSLADLEVLRILNEPTAAALAYGQQSHQKGERVAVYDLGGGTFDITLLDLSGPVFEVLATGGDTMLGGDDIDLLISVRMSEVCAEQYRFDPRADPEAFGRVRVSAEQLKHALSSQVEATVVVPELIPSPGGGQADFPFKMRRVELEVLAAPLVERTFEVCRGVLQQAHTEPAGIDRAILVGGSTRMPLVSHCVEEFFQRQPYARINPDEVVALGAAIQARSLDKGKTSRGLSLRPLASSTPPRPSKVPLTSPLTTTGSLPAISDPTEALFQGLPIVHTPASTSRPPQPLPAPLAPSALPAPPTYATPPHGIVTSLDDQWFSPDELPAATESSMSAAPNASSGSLPAALGPPLPEWDIGEPELDLPPAPAQHAPLAPEPFSPFPPIEPLALPRPAQSEALGRAPTMPLEFVGPVRTFKGPDPSKPPPPMFSPAPAPGSLTRIHTVSTSAPTQGSVASSQPTHASVAQAPPSAASRPPGPMQAVASISSVSPPPLLIDVTPLSLSVETAGGYTDVLLDRNTPVPCDRTRTFTTASDGQTAVIVRVAQGEAKKFEENTYLGELELSGIPPATRGTAEIVVTFEIDADGILNVRARDKSSGIQRTARIHLVGEHADPGDIQQMKDRAAQRPLA